MMHEIGPTLGKYRILAEVGRGGMGVVYKGRDPMLDRLVAIKVLAPHLTWDQEFVQRFFREARAAAGLRHPHIVIIHDVGRAKGHYFIVMEYLEGQSLTMLMRREGALPPARAAHLLDQIAQALDYAHVRGFIHRDVKPGNVIVSPEGHATLTDFGLAKAMADTRLTRTGMLLGTPAYMSPEQVKGGRLTPATDIYSLGVVAYEMLTGQVPFQGETPHAMLHAQVSETPPPLRQLRPDVPEGVETIVSKALAKRPKERWPTAGAFLQALTEALQGVVTVRPAGWERAMGRPHSRRLGWSRIRVLLASLAIVLIVAVAGWRVITGRGTTMSPSLQVAAPSAQAIAAATPTGISIPQPTSTLAPTDTPGPAHGPPGSAGTLPPPACKELIANGGFEIDDDSDSRPDNWNITGARRSQFSSRSGGWAMLLGWAPGEVDSEAAHEVSYFLALPANANRIELTFWYYSRSEDADGDDQYIGLQEYLGIPRAHEEHKIFWRTTLPRNTDTWDRQTYDLTEPFTLYGSNAATLIFGVHNDGDGEGKTYMRIDDVSLVVCGSEIELTPTDTPVPPPPKPPPPKPGG